MDLASMLSPKRRKKAEKLSENMNDFIKGANELAGEEVITPLEDREGMGRLFFTVTPTPSVSPTPSTTPSPSISPTPSVSPSVSATPSYSPSPTTTPTPSSSRTPSPTPTRSPAKNSNSKPNPTPSPSPSSAATVEVINKVETATVPNDGSAIDVGVDFSGENVSAGQQATLTSINAAGDIPATTSRMLLFGTERQETTTPAAYLLFTFSDGSTLIAVPQNQCSDGPGPVTFSSVGASIESENGQLTFSITVEAVGFGDGCAIEIELVVTTETPISSTVSPTPVPSN